MDSDPKSTSSESVLKQAKAAEMSTDQYAYIQAMLQKLQRQLVIRWTIALIGLAIAGFSIYLIAERANHTASAVAHERAQTIRRTCMDQNQRNQRTIAELFKVAAQFIKQHPSEKAQIQASIRSNVLLINDLVPYQNCSQLVKREAPIR